MALYLGELKPISISAENYFLNLCKMSLNFEEIILKILIFSNSFRDDYCYSENANERFFFLGHFFPPK